MFAKRIILDFPAVTCPITVLFDLTVVEPVGTPYSANLDQFFLVIVCLETLEHNSSCMASH
jgi:hypothetical protein